MSTPPDRVSMAQEGRVLRGLFTADQTVDPAALLRLRAPRPVLTAGLRAGLLAENPWLDALRRSGQAPADGAIDEQMVPIEEGETSLNSNANQALASLLPLVLGARQGVSPTVLGTLAGGNHGLDHSLARLARSFPDPAVVRRRLAEVFGPAALAGAAALLAAHSRGVRKSFHRLPAALQSARALRLPPCAIAAPAPERLADLAAALDLDPPLRDLLAGAGDAAAQAGLATVADLFVVVRTLLLRRLAALLGAPRGTHVPATLEALLARGTGAHAQRTLPDLVADLRMASAAPAVRRSSPGRFRALRYWDLVRMLTRGSKPAGGMVQGWSWLWADHGSGALYAAAAERDLLELPLSSLLARGYGLSGRLLYRAVRQVNGGAVCNQLFSSPRPGVFAGLATPGSSALVLPLTWTNVNGAWQTGAELPRCPPVDLLVLMQWIERCSDPEGTLGRLFAAFLEACEAPGRSGLVLAREPGTFNSYRWEADG